MQRLRFKKSIADAASPGCGIASALSSEAKGSLG
jgi:hypothetical protein